VLGRLLTDEIMRYFDPTLERRIDAVHGRLVREIDAANTSLHAVNGPEIELLRRQHTKLSDELRERMEAISREYGPRLAELDVEVKARWKAISDRLQVIAPDPKAVEWPTPKPCDEDPDPMFDSTRDYITQNDRFKQHQGKPVVRREPIRQSFGRPKPKNVRPRYAKS
jgi:hypothetical protein